MKNTFKAALLLIMMFFSTNSNAQWSNPNNVTGNFTINGGYLNLGDFASDPTGIPDGTMWYNTISNTIKIKQGGVVSEIGSGGGGGMAIGDTVTSCTANSIPYCDSSGNLAQANPALTYNAGSAIITVPNLQVSENTTIGDATADTVTLNAQTVYVGGVEENFTSTGNSVGLRAQRNSTAGYAMLAMGGPASPSTAADPDWQIGKGVGTGINNSLRIFQYYPGATSSDIRAVVDTNGDVCIGADVTPDAKLDVEGTFIATGAATLQSTLDVRGNISNGGSGTCDSVGTAGALCVSDTAGTVVSNEGGGDNFALTISTETRTGLERALLIVADEDTSQWLQVTNMTSVSGSFAPGFYSRGDPSTGTGGFTIVAGVEPATDAAMTDAPAFNVDGRRENGTPTTPSGSALTLRPTFGVRNFGTPQFQVEALGGVHIQDSDDIDAGDCDADAEVGRIRRYAKDASNITLCTCQKVGGVFGWAGPVGGDCT